MYIYTILITFCKVGAIWTRNIIWRKSFQSASTIIFMVAIVEITQKKNKTIESYERKNDRRAHADAKSKDRGRKD